MQRKLLLSIPTDAIGLLIGKEGKTFNEISNLSNTKLNLQLHQDIARGSRERFIVIEGEIENICTATKIIIEKLSSRNISSSKIELVKWVIPQARCSVIIGRNGSGIKAINAASGAWVKIAHVEEACPGENQRLLYIRGTKAQNDVALAMVKQIAGGHPLEPTAADIEVHDTSDLFDVTVPAPLVLEALRLVHDSTIEVQIDPEFDVIVGNDVRLKLLSRVNAIGALKALKQQIQSLAATSAPNDNSYVALKVITHIDDNALISSQVHPHAGVILRDVLKQKYNVDVIHLPSFTGFSQSIPLQQFIILGPQEMFFEKLEEIMFFVTCSNDIETFNQALNAMKKSSVTKPLSVPPSYSNNMQVNIEQNMYSTRSHSGRPDEDERYRPMLMQNEYMHNVQNSLHGYGMAPSPIITGPNITQISPMFPSPYHPQQAMQLPPNGYIMHNGYSHMPPQPPTVMTSMNPMNHGQQQQHMNKPHAHHNHQAPIPPTQVRSSYLNQHQKANNMRQVYDHMPMQSSKQSPLMNVAYVTMGGGQQQHSMGHPTMTSNPMSMQVMPGYDIDASLLPMMNMGGYMNPQISRLSGTFLSSDYSFLFSPPISPSSPTRNRKRFGSKNRSNSFTRSRASSSDSVASSIANFYSNLTAIDNADDVIKESADEDDSLSTGVDVYPDLGRLEINEKSHPDV